MCQIWMKAVTLRSIPILLAVLGIFFSVSAQEPDRGLQNYLDLLSSKKTSDELSAQELREVIIIYQRLLDQGITSRATPRPSYESHDIQVSHKNKLFIINGSKYEAQTSCFDFEIGDKVVFVKGTPRGKCVSTELLNLRNDIVCNVWCE